MKKYNRVSVGKIRIIGGQWRGRKIPLLHSLSLRPTKDFIRETLFNWLSPSIINARCLDCFAGSGVLALEALSRYASSVILLEIKKNIAKQLQKIVLFLKAFNAKVVNTDTFIYLSKNSIQYDIVFVDPPFYKGMVEKTIILLEQKGWLADNALIYTESEIENTFLKVPISWRLYREKITGQVVYRLYARKRKGRMTNLN